MLPRRALPPFSSSVHADRARRRDVCSSGVGKATRRHPCWDWGAKAPPAPSRRRRTLKRGGAPCLETVFGRLATQVKDIQRTGSLHAVPARRTCKDKASARESPGAGSTAKPPPSRPVTAGPGPALTGAGLQLAQVPTWMPQIYRIPHPLD